jgi:hypothetical protein
MGGEAARPDVADARRHFRLVSYGCYQFDLHPGEVIATGTPSGVALGSKSWLRPGDSVEAGMEGVGTLHNTVGGMRCPATPDEA